MIDFRYHLISIVAVLLALSIGIVMGTGVLGGPLLEDLKDRVEEVRARNADLSSEIDALQAKIGDQQRFAESAQEFLLPGTLDEEQVVVVEFEGVGGGLVDEVRAEVEDAGGEIASTISISKNLALEDQTDRERLALALGSSSADPADLRRETAVEFGRRASLVAGSENPTAASRVHLESLVEALGEAGFISVSRATDEITIPAGASFLILGGGEALPQFEPDGFTVTLSTQLARSNGGVLAAETEDSTWGLVSAIKDDSAARDSVATVSGANTVEGRIAVVLGLDDAIQGFPGHYGLGEGADQPLPDPTPRS